MLQRWGTINETAPAPAQGETTEAREGRLRGMYEHALRRQASGDARDARAALEEIVADLASSAAKRKRDEGVAEWERVLKYAVSRNLADVCMDAGESVAALSAYAHALEDDSGDFVVWLRAARAAVACGRLHVARRAFEQALRMRPGHWLCVEGYTAVLRAIGDDDEDCALVDGDRVAAMPCVDSEMCNVAAARMLDNRDRELAKECEESHRSKALELVPQTVQVESWRWRAVVDKLSNVLTERMTNTGIPGDLSQRAVGHAVVLLAPSGVEPDSVAKYSETSVVGAGTEAQVTESDAIGKPEMDAILTERLNDTSNGRGAVEIQPIRVENATAAIGEQEEAVVAADDAVTEQEQPDVRRSRRQRAQSDQQAEEADRRQTRTATAVKDDSLENSNLVQSLLEICSPFQQDDVLSMPEKSPQRSHGGARTEECAPPRGGIWALPVSEEQEAIDVGNWLHDLKSTTNGGPIDLLMRIMNKLASKQSSQFSAELAEVWCILRRHVLLSVPGSPTVTACVVEALLSCAQNPGIEATKKLQEAERLSCIVAIESDAAGADGDIKYDSLLDLVIRARFAWLSCQLSEGLGRMQDACKFASHGVNALASIARESSNPLPAIAGPDFANSTPSAAIQFLERHVSSLKRAGELEAAVKALASAGKENNAPAMQAVKILAPSIHTSFKKLELYSWRARVQDAKEKRARLKAVSELERRLKVFSDACSKSGDSIGELICFSVRMRIAVLHYSAQVDDETEGTAASPGERSSSSAGRLAELLMQIRKYVALIKKLSSPSYTFSNDGDTGKCIGGWTVAQAAAVACQTIVVLTELVISKIPIIRAGAAVKPVELSASQKNQRLAFTRCMLAFCRCVSLAHRYHEKACDDPREQENRTHVEMANNSKRVYSQHMLQSLSCCLRALVARGCCKEEGTSGALVKLYANKLSLRLIEIASRSNSNTNVSLPCMGHSQDVSVEPALVGKPDRDTNVHVIEGHLLEQEPAAGSIDVIVRAVKEEDEDVLTLEDSDYQWEDASILRQELAQCYRCLFQCHDLECIANTGTASKSDRWLEEGCNISRNIGLSFSTGAPQALPVMEPDACRELHFLYRKRFFESIILQRREGRRSKRVREVIAQITEALPDDPPCGVPMLAFAALDAVVSGALESGPDISRGAAEYVSKLEDEWNAAVARADRDALSDSPSIPYATRLQYSVMYFETFVLQVSASLAVYEYEFKKQKTVERRKQPREVVERLLNASSDCVAALRSRPWSVGAWILLGRVFIELADVALDEREIAMSPFGAYHAEELASGEGGETVKGILGRAEACFGFAETLERHSWAKHACAEVEGVRAVDVYGLAFTGDTEDSWSGFGDDGDLFGEFGLSNETTSRPRFSDEQHPYREPCSQNSLRMAAICYGKSALMTLRAQEERYWYQHWRSNALERRPCLRQPQTQFSSRVLSLTAAALEQLEHGMRLSYGPTTALPVSTSKPTDLVENKWAWRNGADVMEGNKWYYLLLQAKMMQKLGRVPEDYLPAFAGALEENSRLRSLAKLSTDIEPIYKLHVTRMKILLLDENEDVDRSLALLRLVEQNAFDSTLIASDPKGVSLDEIRLRREAVAKDILAAMQHCRSSSKSGQSHAEFHFKSVYCRALIMQEVLKDPIGALHEVGQMFRGDAAAKALDPGGDGVHRGYFYVIWNYRLTNTGPEPALETERKLIRWRFKLLGLYGRFLRDSGDSRTLSGIVSRLKRRAGEDVPVDGAMIDDLIAAYAEVLGGFIVGALERGVATIAVSETSFRRTWDVYGETLRLSQGVRRVRTFLTRGELSGSGPRKLLESKRPWCLVAIHTALRLEHLRWQCAMTGEAVNMDEARALPLSGSLTEISDDVVGHYAETLVFCAAKWPLDSKLGKLLKRRMDGFATARTTDMDAKFTQ